MGTYIHVSEDEASIKKAMQDYSAAANLSSTLESMLRTMDRSAKTHYGQRTIITPNTQAIVILEEQMATLTKNLKTLSTEVEALKTTTRDSPSGYSNLHRKVRDELDSIRYAINIATEEASHTSNAALIHALKELTSGYGGVNSSVLNAQYGVLRKSDKNFAYSQDLDMLKTNTQRTTGIDYNYYKRLLGNNNKLSEDEKKNYYANRVINVEPSRRLLSKKERALSFTNEGATEQEKIDIIEKMDNSFDEFSTIYAAEQNKTKAQLTEEIYAEKGVKKSSTNARLRGHKIRVHYLPPTKVPESIPKILPDETPPIIIPPVTIPPGEIPPAKVPVPEPVPNVPEIPGIPGFPNGNPSDMDRVFDLIRSIYGPSRHESYLPVPVEKKGLDAILEFLSKGEKDLPSPDLKPEIDISRLRNVTPRPDRTPPVIPLPPGPDRPYLPYVPYPPVPSPSPGPNPGPNPGPSPHPTPHPVPYPTPVPPPGPVTDFSKLYSILTLIWKSMDKLEEAIKKLIEGFANASDSFVGLAGNIFTNPSSIPSGLASGLSSSVGAAGNAVSSVAKNSGKIGMAGGGLLALSGNLAAGLLVGVAGILMHLLGNVIGIATKAVTSYLKVFGTSLSTIVKLIKTVAETSPIIKAIGTLFNLAFTMFFMPMFNALGTQLIPAVLDFVTKAIDMGQSLQNSLLDIFPENVIADISDSILNLMTDFSKNLLPSFLELVPDLVEMTKDFADIFTAHKDELLSFVKKGIAFALGFLNNDKLIGSFFELSTSVMTFLEENKELIYQVITALLSLLKVGADVTTEITNPRTWVSPVNNPMDFSSVINNAIKGADNIMNAVNNGIATAATGGIVTPTPGGSLIRVAEAGESEAIIPLSELSNTIGGNTLVVNFNGTIYGMSDFKQAVRDIITDVSNKSYFR